MKIVERLEGSIPVASISGDVDLDSSAQLREFLKQQAARKTAKLVLDFSEVNYIDSSGLATLIEYFNLARKYEGKLILAALTPRVKNAFDIVRLDQIFSLHSTVSSAVTALK